MGRSAPFACQACRRWRRPEQAFAHRRPCTPGSCLLPLHAWLCHGALADPLHAAARSTSRPCRSCGAGTRRCCASARCSRCSATGSSWRRRRPARRCGAPPAGRRCRLMRGAPDGHARPACASRLRHGGAQRWDMQRGNSGVRCMESPCVRRACARPGDPRRRRAGRGAVRGAVGAGQRAGGVHAAAAAGAHTWAPSSVVAGHWLCTRDAARAEPCWWPSAQGSTASSCPHMAHKIANP